MVSEFNTEKFVSDKEYRELFARGYLAVLDEDLYNVLTKKATEDDVLDGHLSELDDDATNPFYIGAVQAFEDHRNDCCQHWQHVDNKFCCFHKHTRS